MIFFDTETTGLIRNLALHLSKQPHIIEIGAVTNVIDIDAEYSQLINPGIKLPEIITKITGLTDEDLKDAPTFAEAWEKLNGFFYGYDTLVAHNMPFDKSMMKFELRRMDVEWPDSWPNKFIDTVQLARPLYKGKFMKLNALYEDLIGPVKQAHRALDDAKMLRDVYLAIVRKLG